MRILEYYRIEDEDTVSSTSITTIISSVCEIGPQSSTCCLVLGMRHDEI